MSTANPSGAGRLLRCTSFLALALALAVPTLAQDSVALEITAYFPDAENDSWLFETPADARNSDSDTQRTLHASEASQGGELRVDSSDGSLRVHRVNARLGWALVEEASLGGRRLLFEEPLVLLPSRTETGATHESEGRYRMVVDEDVVSEGTVRATVNVGALTSVEAVAGSFDDCLAVDIVLEFSSDEEPDDPKTHRRRLWRARGVGPVREIAGASTLDLLLAPEAESLDEETEWLLVEAAVSGTLVTAPEDPRPATDLGPFEPPPR